MLVTKQPVLKHFWYPVIPVSHLTDQPYSFELLGESLVLWLDSQAKAMALQDRCCHRSAKLSLGTICQGNISCPYHGWQFNGSGVCVQVPQLQSHKPIPPGYRVKAYACRESYGYVWVCLEDPLTDLPLIEEAFDPDYRLIPEFYETWHCAGLRVMENEFDLAHPAFVHQESFGSQDHVVPDQLTLKETEWGISVSSTLGVVNTPLQQQNLKMSSPQTQRTLEMTWFMPFTVKLKIAYPNGLEHIIVNTMTPISDSKSQMVQFCLRNDTEADTPSGAVVAFDRQVTTEDKRILESTDYDVPLNPSLEEHMFTDKPGLIMRRKFLELLKAHGETEQTRH